MEAMQFSERAKALRPGVYEHYKGNRYRVLGVAFHSETEEELVIYQALYGAELTWVRPLATFCEDIEVGGGHKLRFTYIGD